MKRISLFLAAALLVFPAFLRAQDAATEERLNKLSAQIQDLVDAREAQGRRIDELAKAIQSLQQQVNKPTGNYASAEDVKHLADKLLEIDRKRMEDNEMIARKIEDLGKTLTTSAARTPSPRPPATPDAQPTRTDKGFEYTSDTLSAIVAAYKEKNIKVTVEEIVQANPGLDPNKMRIGQKIFIPAPRN